jgi:hypothetical protein
MPQAWRAIRLATLIRCRRLVAARADGGRVGRPRPGGRGQGHGAPARHGAAGHQDAPTLDGLGALELLRRQVPALRIVLLTSFGEEPNVLRALQNGAAGVLLKNCTPSDELIRAVLPVSIR